MLKKKYLLNQINAFLSDYWITQTYTHTHTYIYIYIYIERERERYYFIIQSLKKWTLVWNTNEKKQEKSNSVFNFTTKKDNTCHLILWVSSFCFKDYIIQILHLMSYILMKRHPEVLQHLPRHCRWYCCNFMMNEIFQSVCRLQPTFQNWMTRNQMISMLKKEVLIFVLKNWLKKP